MRTFRSLLKYNQQSRAYLEFINNSFWWGNQYILLKNDSEMFRYFEKNKIDKSRFVTGNVEGLDNDGSYYMQFEPDSRGYSGLIVDWYSKDRYLTSVLNSDSGIIINRQSGTIHLTSTLNNSSGKDKMNFLAEISSISSLEFTLDYLDRKCRILIDKDIHEYIVKNLSPDKLFEKNQIVKYYQGNENVALFCPKIISSIN
jgi:hypothetical protein